MHTRRKTIGVAVLLYTVTTASGGCGNEPTGMEDPPKNTAPTLASIPDQTVVRNTLTPRSAVIDLSIQDPDDATHTVTVSSDDAGVLDGAGQTCGPGPCSLTLTPAADATAAVTVTVTVADDDGAQARAAFLLRVEPAEVTTTANDGQGSLRQVVADAEPGDVIGFDTRGAFASPSTISLLGEIEIDRSVTVEGTGTANLTVSGGSVGRALKISSGASVTVSDLTIADGTAPLETLPGAEGPFDARVGGGVLLLPAGALTLRTVHVVDNAASGEGAGGGGLANLGGTLVLEDATVEGNRAPVGGGILSMDAESSGAAMLILGGAVAHNVAELLGGGVANLVGTLTVRGSRLEENDVTDGQGGGIYTTGDALLEQETEILSNMASREGGGVFIRGSTVTIDASVVEGNAADFGAGIFDDGDLVLRAGSRVAGNTATNGGGGIQVEANAAASIHESVLEDNDATSAGGGIYSMGELALESSTVAGNRAGQGGGIMVAGPLSVTAISASAIQGNTATTGTGGGLKSKGSGGLVMEDSDVSGNRAAGGGGIYSDSSLEIVGSTIADNVSDGSGGGLRLFEPGGASVTSSVVSGNSAVRSGGGFFISGSGQRTTLTGTVVAQNEATDGGGIVLAASAGALLSIEGESRVEDNRARLRGGGLVTTGAGALIVLIGSDVSRNAAEDGGGVAVLGGGVEAREASSIDNNTAERDGGGIRLFRGGVTLVEESPVIANRANNDGGGVHLSSDDSVLAVIGSSCSILANVADADASGVGSGGGIYNDGGSIASVPTQRVCLNDPDDIVSN